MRFFGKIRSDVRNYDRKNEDEQKVLDARFFSAYKGKFVIRAGGFGKRSFSFGSMFIARAESHREDGCITVRHEYGHTQQLERLGFRKYIKHVAIPSLKSDGKALPEIYYNSPHEITADILGGVERGTHTDEAKEAGLNYLNRFSRSLSDRIEQ